MCWKYQENEQEIKTDIPIFDYSTGKQYKRSKEYIIIDQNENPTNGCLVDIDGDKDWYTGYIAVDNTSFNDYDVSIVYPIAWIEKPEGVK